MNALYVIKKRFEEIFVPGRSCIKILKLVLKVFLADLSTVRNFLEVRRSRFLLNLWIMVPKFSLVVLFFREGPKGPLN